MTNARIDGWGYDLNKPSAERAARQDCLRNIPADHDVVGDFAYEHLGEDTVKASIEVSPRDITATFN